MIENSKCECGHNNPIGTILCEYCGKPLLEEGSDQLEQEMRYEGKARRSQLVVRSPVDWIWNFFSSVKIAIVLILITLILASLGTIFPQEDFIPSNTPETYYQETYGTLGNVFYQLGLSVMYDSWWFFSLLAMIGISLVICSLDRVVPLYKALNNQRVEKNVNFMKRQRLAHHEEISVENVEQKIDRWVIALQEKRYQVKREGNALLAEKGRLSRWGPYINHIGLILFLLAALLRWIPGWSIEEFVWVRDGETKKIPTSSYYVKNERSFTELYPNKQVVKKYQTDAVIYEKNTQGQLKQVHKQSIMVNHPLKYKGYELFQSSLNPELGGVKLKLSDRKAKQDLGTFSVQFAKLKPNQRYQVGDHTIRLLEYYPDFALDKNQQPITLSQAPNRPAMIFEVFKSGQGKGEKIWVISGENLDTIMKDNQYTIDLDQLQMINKSGLIVRTDKSLPFLFAGGLISMVGLAMGFYFQHRRIWLRVQDQTLYLGAHTNKNWYSLRRELQQIAKKDKMQLHFVKE